MSSMLFRLPSLRRPAFGLVLLTCAGLAATPGHAQTELDLGVSGTTVSGTATVTENGATASGTYTYNDNGTGTPLDQQKAFGELNAYGNSTLNLTGGTIVRSGMYPPNFEPGYVGGYDASTVNVSGGEIGGFLDIYNTSVLNFSGGSVGESLNTFDSSTANVSGGSIQNLGTYDTSTANVSGGTINGSFDTFGTSITNISGGNFANLVTYDSSTVNLFGTGLTETYLGYDPFYGTNAYSITGTLQNGDALNAHYYDYSGELVFNPVPEASSVVSLCLLLLGLGGIAVSRKRKGQATA